MLTTLLGLAVVMLAGHALGAKGLGDISLVVLGMTFILLVSHVMGGGAVVYLLPRYPLHRLLPPAYAWAIATAGIAAWILGRSTLVPEGTAVHVAALALLHALGNLHLNVLLGLQRMRLYNLLSILQAAMLAIAFVLLLQRTDSPSVMTYIQAAYVAHGGLFVLSILPVVLLRRPAPLLPAERPMLHAMIRQGGLIQGANLLQLLNYRFAYYLLDHYQGRMDLGVYSVGNQLAEGAWIGPKAMGTVLYGQVSNLSNDQEAAQRTRQALFLSVGMATLVLLVLVLLPDSLFSQLFGKEVTGLRVLLCCLAPGILAMAASQAFSHFFSGTGRNKHNLIGSGLGLLVTMAAGWYLISVYGMIGAACTASLAYLTNGLYQAGQFLRIAQWRPGQLVPSRKELRSWCGTGLVRKG
ncbi:MAG: polysaccharide biosynthesis C-terminal domain-containing protein [Flavobacteriales bacterium]|nr:polysaccharide biosynthesis C-terminal domain-containing protein [Flavobacteriales bacterium]